MRVRGWARCSADPNLIMTTTSPHFEDLRSAFCARFRCTPPAFERKVFWKSLPLRVKLLTIFFGGMSHPRFQHDLEMIRAAGDASSVDDINRVFDKMWSLHEMNRDRLRHWLGLRPSTERLQSIFAPLLRNIRAAVPEVEVPVPMPQGMNPLRLPAERYRPGDVPVHRLRRVLRIHAAVGCGRELEQILKVERTSRRELDELVDEFARLRSEIGWLKIYLRERDELEELRRVARIQSSRSAA